MAGGNARKRETGYAGRAGRREAARRRPCLVDGSQIGSVDEWMATAPFQPDRRHDDADAIAICDGVIDLAGALFDVPTCELRRTGRTGLEAAQVRQIAMYAAHVTLGLTMRQVGVGFQRDRTTVLYACHLVEDQRDDAGFDRVVAHVERVVAASFQGRRGR